MLKKKLDQHREGCNASTGVVATASVVPLEAGSFNMSHFFDPPLWRRFYHLECLLNEQLQHLPPPANITHIYNPVEYASELHCEYLRRYLDGVKQLMFVGMNPGANGMGQTGVSAQNLFSDIEAERGERCYCVFQIPFGNISTVRRIMAITGDVGQPPHVHPKRPVSGLQCTIEEPSGLRIWTLLQQLAGGSLQTFARQCFVHNFCPLAFFDKDGKNITPSELKGEYKLKIRDLCLYTLDKQIELVRPKIVVAVGEYVHTCLKKSAHAGVVTGVVKILKLPHPSPRSLNNHNWPAKAELWLREQDLIKYISDQAEGAELALS